MKNSIKPQTKVLKASMTLESSFIYPIIIIVSVMLIMYTFFIHDKVAVQSGLYRILIDKNEDMTTDDSLNDSLDDICTQLESICLLTHSFDIKYLEDSGTLKLTDDSTSDTTAITSSVSFSGYERCDYIRQYYAILSQIMK